MIPYIIFFLIPIMFFLHPLKGSSGVKLLSWSLIIILGTLFIGLRYRVGGDWSQYLYYLYQTRNVDFLTAIQIADPGYMAINWLSQKLNLGITNYKNPSNFYNNLKPIIGHTIPWQNDYNYLISNVTSILFDIADIQAQHFRDAPSALNAYQKLLKYYKLKNIDESSSAAWVYYGLYLNKWNTKPYGDKMGACKDFKKAAELNNETFYSDYLNSGCY